MRSARAGGSSGRILARCSWRRVCSGKMDHGRCCAGPRRPSSATPFRCASSGPTRSPAEGRAASVATLLLCGCARSHRQKGSSASGRSQLKLTAPLPLRSKTARIWRGRLPGAVKVALHAAVASEPGRRSMMRQVAFGRRLPAVARAGIHEDKHHHDADGDCDRQKDLVPSRPVPASWPLAHLTEPRRPLRVGQRESSQSTTRTPAHSLRPQTR